MIAVKRAQSLAADGGASRPQVLAPLQDISRRSLALAWTHISFSNDFASMSRTLPRALSSRLLSKNVSSGVRCFSSIPQYPPTHNAMPQRPPTAAMPMPFVTETVVCNSNLPATQLIADYVGRWLAHMCVPIHKIADLHPRLTIIRRHILTTAERTHHLPKWRSR